MAKLNSKIGNTDLKLTSRFTHANLFTSMNVYIGNLSGRWLRECSKKNQLSWSRKHDRLTPQKI